MQQCVKKSPQTPQLQIKTQNIVSKFPKFIHFKLHIEKKIYTQLKV